MRWARTEVRWLAAGVALAPAVALALVALCASGLAAQDAVTGTPRQKEFEGGALASYQAGREDELRARVAEHPYRALTLVHNLLRQSAVEGADSWALGAARAVAQAHAMVAGGADLDGSSATAQVARYAAFDAAQRRMRLEFDDLWNAVAAAMARGDPAAAEERGLESLALARELGDPWLEATAQRRIGRLLTDLGRTDAALEALRAALALDRAHGATLDEAQDHARLGHAYFGRGLLAEALAAYEQSLATAARTDEAAPVSVAELGALYAQFGRFDEARAALRAALETAATAGERAFALTALGALANTLGLYDEAREHLAAAIAAARLAGDRVLEGGARVTLGGLETELGRAVPAERELRAALELLAGEQARVQRAYARLHLATVQLDRGRAQAALTELERSATLFGELGHAHGERDVLAVRGRALAALARLDESEAAWRECARERRAAGEVFGARSAEIGLAEVLERRGDAAAAVEVARGTLAELAPVDLPELRWRAAAIAARALTALALEAEALEAEALEAEALAMHRVAVEGVEALRSALVAPTLRGTYLEERLGVYRRAALAHLDAGDLPRTFALMEAGKARLLLERHARGADGGSARSGPAGSALRAAEDRLARSERRYTAALAAEIAASVRADARAVLHMARDALERARFDYELALPRRAALGGLALAPTAAELSASFGRDMALVEYMVGSEGCAAVVVRGGELWGVRLAVTESALIADIDRLAEPIAALRAGTTDLANLAFDVAAARALYDALVAPLAARLEGCDTVWIVPDAELWRAPFAAFVVSIAKRPVDPEQLYRQYRANRYWIDETALGTAPSAAVLLATMRPRATGGEPEAWSAPLFLADPRPLPAGASALPFARREVDVLRRSLPVGDGARFGPEAAEARFKRDAESATWIHLAVHGELDDRQPRNSRLALAPGGGEDGWLYAFEVEGLQLGARHVVLSACESGGGVRRGEGILGLTRAFLSAGAPSVLASRWVVEDRAGAAFFERYYRALGAGRVPVQALREAQIWAAHAGGRAGLAYAHPFFWAGFLHVGAP